MRAPNLAKFQVFPSAPLDTTQPRKDKTPTSRTFKYAFPPTPAAQTEESLCGVVVAWPCKCCWANDVCVWALHSACVQTCMGAHVCVFTYDVIACVRMRVWTIVCAPLHIHASSRMCVVAGLCLLPFCSTGSRLSLSWHNWRC